MKGRLQWLAEAEAVVTCLRDALAAQGLQSVAAPRNPFGAGLAVPWEEGTFSVMAVMAGEPRMVNFGSAVLRSVAQTDKVGILYLTNLLTRENPLMPVVLHNAEAGWDVIAMQRFSYQLLMENQSFMCESAHALAYMAREVEERFQQFGGRPPQWRADEIHELVIRTTL
jgi:hypothetical protein